MAKGFISVAGVYNDTETNPLAPAGSALAASPVERVYVYNLTINVLKPGVGVCQVQDDATGNVFAILDTSVVRSQQWNYATSYRGYGAKAIAAGGALVVNLNSAGAQVEVDAVVEVR